jgi:hypothetical protein
MHWSEQDTCCSNYAEEGTVSMFFWGGGAVLSLGKDRVAMD